MNRAQEITLGSVVAVVAGLVAFLWARPDPAPDAYTGFAAVEPVVIATPSPVTAEGMELFRDRYLAQFGDTLVDDGDLHDGHADFERAVPGSPNRMVAYTYRDGFEAARAPSTRPVDTPVFDLAAMDIPTIAGFVAGAPASVGVPDGTVDHIALTVENGEPVVRIYAGNEANESGFLEITPEGELLEVSRFEP